MLTVLLTGFFACLAIIVAIGPQSAYLLRQGLRRDRVVLADGGCLVGDALLLSAGPREIESRCWSMPGGCWTSCAGRRGLPDRFATAHPFEPTRPDNH